MSSDVARTAMGERSASTQLDQSLCQGCSTTLRACWNHALPPPSREHSEHLGDRVPEHYHGVNNLVTAVSVGRTPHNSAGNPRDGPDGESKTADIVHVRVLMYMQMGKPVGTSRDNPFDAPMTPHGPVWFSSRDVVIQRLNAVSLSETIAGMSY